MSLKNENFQQKMFYIFLIFAQNIDCGYSLEPPQLCFGAKIRKIGIPLHTPVLLYKSGVQGVYITRTCFRDEIPSSLTYKCLLWYGCIYAYITIHVTLNCNVYPVILYFYIAKLGYAGVNLCFVFLL